MKKTTVIISNGSGLAGPIGTLIARLKSNTLDPVFEEYGDFIDEHANPETGWTLFGNFYDYSHVFNIRTWDAALVAKIRKLVDANKATAAYAKARKERAENRAFWATHEKRQRKAQRQPRR